MREDIAKIRKHYSKESLLETNAAKNPIEQFNKWWEEAIEAAIDEPNAMTLATASSEFIVVFRPKFMALGSKPRISPSLLFTILTRDVPPDKR